VWRFKPTHVSALLVPGSNPFLRGILTPLRVLQHQKWDTARTPASNHGSRRFVVELVRVTMSSTAFTPSPRKGSVLYPLVGHHQVRGPLLHHRIAVCYNRVAHPRTRPHIVVSSPSQCALLLRLPHHHQPKVCSFPLNGHYQLRRRYYAIAKRCATTASRFRAHYIVASSPSQCALLRLLQRFHAITSQR